MGEILISVLNQMISFEVIVAMLIGVIVGLVVGSIPGLTATMAIALMIPITFSMEPIPGLVMLVSVYSAGMYGGAFAAILLNTPGTPSSAATSLDGYPMTQQGRSAKAIGVATVSSVIGGVVSGIFLLFLAPPLSTISLLFSAPEYFFIAIFGLTIIGSLSGDSMIKGFTAGVIGLFIGTIGVDLITGFPRFTFGNASLESGVSLIPALIGFFSVSQVMILAENREGKNTITTRTVEGKPLPTKKEFKSIRKTISRSSIIGLLVGILPGAGGDIGAWMSYNEAKRVSKDKENFGKGSIEGLAASEAGNNATTGGSLIPMLTLGIPGSAATAVMLGGIISQGLVPGRELFTLHAETTYSVIIGFIFATIIMGIIGIFSAKYIVKVATVPNGIIAPMIIGFSVIGAYALNNNYFDVWVMFFAGIIGYLMRKTGFPVAPIILGLILGPIAEEGLRQSMAMTSEPLVAYFLQRPVSVVLIILTLLSIIVPTYRKYRKKH